MSTLPRPLEWPPIFPLDKSLVLWLPFDDRSGAKAYDRSGKKNHGAITAATWVAGRRGSALLFDGTQGYITISDADNLDLTEMTFMFLVKPSVVTGLHDLLSKSISTVRNYRVNLSGSDVRAEFHDTLNNRHLWQSSLLGLSTSVFQHVGVTIKNGAIEIFKDGIKYGGSWMIGTGVGTPKVNADPLYIVYPVSDWFSGIIAGVRVYSRVLSAAEIKRHAESELMLVRH